MGKRLFTIEVLAQFEGRMTWMKMRVIGRTHHHRVDLFFDVVEHAPIIMVPARFGEAVKCVSRALVIDVTQGDDVLAGFP